MHFMSKCLVNQTKRISLFRLREDAITYTNFHTFKDEQKATFALNSQNPQIVEKMGLFVFLFFQKEVRQAQPL